MPDQEDVSVYYDIPGEGSSDGVKEISDSDIDDSEQKTEEQYQEESSEDEIIQIKPKRPRKNFFSVSEENSNQGSTVSSATNSSKRKRRSKYEHDDDFEVEVFTDEASNISDASHATRSTVNSFKRRRPRGATSHDSGIVTRNKVKSRSTSRSAIVSDENELSEVEEHTEESDFEIENDESDNESDEQAVEYADTEEEEEEEEEDQSDDDERSNVSDASFDDDSDSIDIKYSPIKTRHARRKIYNMNLKQIRGTINLCEYD